MGRPRKHRRDLPERVYYKCGAYYYVHATTKWERLDSDYPKAMARWAELVQTNPNQSIVSVGALLDRYLLEVVPSKAERTQKDNRQEIRFLRAFFGSMVLNTVRPQHIAAYVAARSAKTRCNRELALLSNAFSKAILWGIADSNPAAAKGVRNTEKPRERYVTDEEIEKFKEACPEWLKHYVNLKLLLGLRQRDMLNLTWKDIGPENLIVSPLKTMKHGTKIAIRLTPEVQETLNLLKNDSPYLFATRSGAMYSSAGFGSIWRRLMAQHVSNGNERFTEHDLRGKVATDMSDPNQAQRLLGHKSIKMTEAYIKQRRTDVVEPARRKK